MRLIFLVVFTISTAILYYIALINVTIVVTTGQYSRVGALTGFTVDTALYRAVYTIADGTELYRPRLPTNKVALAVEVSKSIAGEVAATITGGLQRV